VRSGKDGALSEWAAGGEFTTASAPDTPAPTALAAVDVIDKAAKLTWQHVDADSHEVIVGDGDAVTVTGTGYDVSGLTPQTTYTWKVRSCKYGVWSEWVEGDEFTTGVLQFLGAGTVSWYDTQYGEDTQNYQIIFIDYDPGKGNPDKGISMKLDVCFSRAELGVDSGRRALDFPNATYTVTDNTVNPAINTILAFYCDVNVYEGHVPTRKGIKSGSMTVTGNYVDGYHMTFDFVLEDDSVIIAEYNGQFVINNPKL
jgi:hypothetical protein